MEKAVFCAPLGSRACTEGESRVTGAPLLSKLIPLLSFFQHIRKLLAPGEIVRPIPFDIPLHRVRGMSPGCELVTRIAL